MGIPFLEIGVKLEDHPLNEDRKGLKALLTSMVSKHGDPCTLESLILIYPSNFDKNLLLIDDISKC